MKNIEIKKEIENTIRLNKINKNNIELKVVLWHGETVEHKDAIYNDVLIYNNNELINSYNSMYGELEKEDVEENLKALKEEQSKIKAYLGRYFKNVSITEQNI